MARVSGARFVWPCSLARMMLLEDALSTYLGVIGSRRRNPYKVKQGMKPDTCQGNKFVLGCTNDDGAAGFMVPGWEGEGANSCCPHI